MNSSNIPIKLRYQLFKEYFKTATLIHGLYVIDRNGKMIIGTNIPLEETLPM